jgi:hypothetical protein
MPVLYAFGFKLRQTGLYEIFESYWTATAISTRKYPVPFDPGIQAGKSPPSTAVREGEYLQRAQNISNGADSQLEHRTGPHQSESPFLLISPV